MSFASILLVGQYAYAVGSRPRPCGEPFVGTVARPVANKYDFPWTLDVRQKSIDGDERGVQRGAGIVTWKNKAG
jgi:hypothetical protein